jgi:hypothetical protein
MGGLNRWVEQASCLQLRRSGQLSRADTERLFFPVRENSKFDLQEAQDICAECPVLRQCGELALSRNEEEHVYAGMAGATRRVLRRRVRKGEVTVDGGFWASHRALLRVAAAHRRAQRAAAAEAARAMESAVAV